MRRRVWEKVIKRRKILTSQEILDFTTQAISDRHGEDTEAYDMRGISILADYYVITSAGSNRQLHAIVNSIVDAAHENNYTDYRIEGDVVVNVFTKEAREFYNLEKLWANGKQVELKED